MILFILGLVVFLGMHSLRIVVPGFRDARMKKMGFSAWKGFYALFSLLGLTLIIIGYGQARGALPDLYYPPFWLRHITLLLMLASFILLAVSVFPAGKIKARLKHPMLIGTKIWALGHLLANGDLASVILFAAFLAWAVIAMIAANRRGVSVKPGSIRNDLFAIIAGFVFYILFVLFAHEPLIGVSPIA